MSALIRGFSRARCPFSYPVLTIFAIVTIFSAAALAPAQDQAGRAESAGGRAHSRELTHRLLRLRGSFEHALGVDRAAVLGDMVKTAAERHQALKELMKQDPGEMLKLSIPAAVRSGFPPNVRAWIEEEAVLEGELEVTYEEGVGKSRLLFALQTEKGRYSLHFAKEEPTDMQTGARVRVHGIRLDDALALASGSGSSSMEVLTAPLPNTFGEQKTAVILVNFQDNTSEPYTVDHARDVVFHTTSDFDMENSQGRTWLTGDVFGWYTIPVSWAECDPNAISTYARQAAEAEGVDLSSYHRFVYGFPNNACGWWGLGTVGGNPSHAWINGSFSLKVVGHEMGHNLGLYHSRTATNEYGDTLDIMGNPSSDHFNAFQKERLGWLNYEAQPPITTAEIEGDYFIAPYETGDSEPKALKILKSVDPATGRRTWYYVEHRRGIGFDGSIASNRNVLDGIVIHTGSESTGNSSFLLDMTPETATFTDPALVAGSSFSDAAAGVTITTLSTSDSGASVRVMAEPTACLSSAPSLSAPATSPYGSAGETLRYTLILTNSDSAACAATVFDFIGAPPAAGWTATVDPPSVILGAGAVASVTVDITSPSSAADGLYDTIVSALDRADSSRTASATLSYGVSTPTCIPGVPALAGASPATLTGPAGSPLTFTFTLTDGNGSTCGSTTYEITASGPAGWSVAANPASVILAAGAGASFDLTVTPPPTAVDGMYSIDVAAVDRGGAAGSASAAVTCDISTDFSASIVTDKADYAPGKTVTVTTAVEMNGSPAVGAEVALTITKPDGTVVREFLTTRMKGTAVYKYRLDRKDPAGRYTVKATVTVVSRSVEASTAFTVSGGASRKR